MLGLRRDSDNSILYMWQFLDVSRLEVKQCFLFQKHFIIINDLSLTITLQGRSVAKHKRHG